MGKSRFTEERRRRESRYRCSLGEPQPGASLIIPGLKMGGTSDERYHRCRLPSTAPANVLKLPRRSASGATAAIWPLDRPTIASG